MKHEPKRLHLNKTLTKRHERLINNDVGTNLIKIKYIDYRI